MGEITGGLPTLSRWNPEPTFLSATRERLDEEARKTPSDAHNK